MADAVHDGPRMNQIIHRAVRRDIDRFGTALATFRTGDRDKADALADAFEQFGTLLTHHHEGEEEHLWPVIRKPPDSSAEVAELTDEHEAIASALASARAAFRALHTSNGSDDAAAAARRAVEELRSAASEHFAHEERELEDLCARADPAALAVATRKLGRDAGLRESTYFLRWVDDDASSEDRAFLRRLIPPPVHLLAKAMAGRRYARVTNGAFAP
jgi:hemerythrin-like domain-containing protein